MRLVRGLGKNIREEQDIYVCMKRIYFDLHVNVFIYALCWHSRAMNINMIIECEDAIAKENWNCL